MMESGKQFSHLSHGSVFFCGPELLGHYAAVFVARIWVTIHQWR